jgi:hypothetical protein
VAALGAATDRAALNPHDVIAITLPPPHAQPQMPKLAILIPGSATPAFYSQIAAISLALNRLKWTRWEPTIYAFFGENKPAGDPVFARWGRHLGDVEIHRVSLKQYALHGNWAQVDSTLRLAPRDADVLLCLDADTLPVRHFEQVLDDLVEHEGVAGVLAHYPIPGPAASVRENWAQVSDGLLNRPLEFNYAHSLVSPYESPDRRASPFYLNGGVMFFSRRSFEVFVPRYLNMREQLMPRLRNPDFSAQVASTLAIVEEGLREVELPMRYNFPNDPIAEALYPDELGQATIFHYLRTTSFQRHLIFASANDYSEFLAMPLAGVNRVFQDSVRSMIGERYPFS